jgi:outer membrane protein TolC
MKHTLIKILKKDLSTCNLLLFATAFLWIIWSVTSAMAVAQTPSAQVAFKDLLQPEGNQREQQLINLVEQVLAADTKTGAWQQVKNRQLIKLSLQQAALAGIEKNLSVAISRTEALQARRAILEAKAIFDPVFELSVNYEEQESRNRRLTGAVNAQVFEPAISGDPDQPPERGNIILSPQARELSGVERIVFPDTRSRVERVEQTIFASREDPNGPTETATYSVNLDQQLPWGIRYNVAALTTDRDVFYDTRGNSFDASWSSELLFNLEIPVPGSKDFGPYAVTDTALKLAKKASERGFWALKSTLNETLLAINLAYLNLVQSLGDLEAASQNRLLLERQKAQIERLFQAQLATRYDLAQIDAELAQANAQEEVAANAFIGASDILAPLINYSSTGIQDHLYLPAGYTLWLATPLEFDEDAALTLAKRYRPALQVSRVDVAASEILKRQAAQETRPDVTVDVSLEALQDGSVYGYKSYTDSLEALHDPDTFNQSYGLRYRYPVGNRAFKARLAQAKGTVKNSRLGLQATYNQVVQEVNDALITIRTAQERIDHTKKQLSAARNAYDSLVRLKDAGGDVNTNELIITTRRLLEAQFASIAARIDRKRAESNLLAAQGLLSQYSPGWISRNGFERYRLQGLAESAGFEYFLK